MKTVWKHALVHGGPQEILTLRCPRIAMVGMQDGVLCVWIEGFTDGREKIHFQVFGTGHAIDDNMVFAGSTQGSCVWHVYQKAPQQRLAEGEGSRARANADGP